MNFAGLVRLGDLCTVITKGTTPTTLGLDFSDRGVPFLRAQDINGEVDVNSDLLYISAETHAALSRSQILPGDVLLTIAGTIGRPAIVPLGSVEMNCNQAVAILRPIDSLDRRYLFHWLKSHDARSQIYGSTVTATISNLSLGQIGGLRLLLPPLDEQRRIAAILDKADALRQKRKLAIALLDSLTQSIFLEMFGGEQRWPDAPLANVVKPGTIVTYGIVQAGEEYEGGIPYIRTGDIQDGKIAVHGLRRTNPAIAAKFERSRVRADEIVMSIRATVGTVALVPPEIDGANLTQGTARISPGPNVNGLYLLHYLRSAGVQAWIKRQVKGATFLEITLGRLRELMVALPPLDLQNEFASRISAVTRLSILAGGDQAHLDFLFASLQHRAFSGQL